MGRLDFLYRSEVSNRAVSTFLYLKRPREQKRGMLAVDTDDRERT